MLGKDVKEIAIKNMNWGQANDVIRVLMENDYVVMVSREENLIVIDYVYDDGLMADRNGVAFMPLYELDENYNRKVADDERY